MKPLLLLVDDNVEMIEVLTDELSEKYQIITAINGQQALATLSKASIELVISDVMMPVMDGYELCKTIKSNFEYSHVPVILLTAKNTLKSRIVGLELGADAYIEKPFDVEHLLVQIANLLANRNKLKAYFAKVPSLHPDITAYSGPEERFVTNLNEVIQTHMEDQELDVDKLARFMNVSRSSLFRKIKSITDLTPNEYINLTRLKKAAELLADGKYKIYEVSDLVGYGSHTNFGRNFFKHFRMTPTDYQKIKQAARTDE